MPSVIALLAEVLAATDYADLSLEAREAAHRAIVDWLGWTLVGSTSGQARAAQGVIARFGVSHEATVFGAGRAAAAAAAFANGVASQSPAPGEKDAEPIVQGIAPIVPAAFAVAEREHAPGTALMTAVAVGHEAARRIWEAVGVRHRYRSYTECAPTFGAAVAAASLMRLDADAMRQALSNAPSAGTPGDIDTENRLGPVGHTGRGAWHGIMAADLARVGIAGARRMLDGDRGFFRRLGDTYDATRITDGLGTQWNLSAPVAGAPAEAPAETRAREQRLFGLVARRVGRETANGLLRAVHSLDACEDLANLFRDVPPADVATHE